jgi:hypothetical protein
MLRGNANNTFQGVIRQKNAQPLTRSHDELGMAILTGNAKTAPHNYAWRQERSMGVPFRPGCRGKCALVDFRLA